MFKLVLLILLFLPQMILAQKGEDLIHLKFDQITIDQNNYFVINMQLEKDWHVYWKNAGDSGIPTEWTFKTKNNSLQIDMLEWPAPKQFKEAGDLWTYGYNDEQNFYSKVLPLKNSDDELSLVADFLVCRELCIPAKFNFTFDITNGKIVIPEELQTHLTSSLAEENLANLPKIEPLAKNISWELYHLENTNQLRLVFKNTSAYTISENHSLVTPFLAMPFNYRHQKVEGNTAVLEIDWDGQYLDPPQPLPANNTFAKPSSLNFLWRSGEKSSVVNIQVSNFKTINLDNWNKLTKSSVSESQKNNYSLMLMILFAVIGGFILNFMPCVLPVITLKLYSLIHHQNKSKIDLLKHNGSYVGGVLTCFWILATIIITLRSTGDFIGWGFQLQSPPFVWSMILLFFILSLNLFGLFEFKTPAGRLISNLRSQHPYIDDYLSGLLAVIVATPCSAPFLGPALTFAFSENSFTIFLIFSFMGLGLSLPFIISAVFPKSLKLLPRPGVWMNTFKYLMGFALLMTVIWLFEVLQNLINFSQVSFNLYTTLGLVFFSIFLVSKQKNKNSLQLFLIIFALFNLYRSYSAIINNPLQESTTKSLELTSWQPWNEDTIAHMIETKEIFFVDATAKWCITCQVNKKLVFETKAFLDLQQKLGFKTLRLDWTKKDQNMFQWLQNNGAVSVPAYFLGINGKIKFLGETISLSKIENAIQNP